MGEPMDRSNRFLVGLPTTFDEALPNLEDAVVEYYETGKLGPYGFDPLVGPRDGYGTPLSVRSTGGLIRCSNPFCRRGGFEIDFDVHDMLSRKLVRKEFVKKCPGDEGSPKGRRIGRTCMNALHYRITLRYKPEHAPARVKLKERLTVMEFPRCPACRQPLVEEQEEGNHISCGQHVFKRLGDRRLELMEKSDAHWWTKVGEAVEISGAVAVEVLKLDAQNVAQLTVGTASEQLVREASLASPTMFWYSWNRQTRLCELPCTTRAVSHWSL